MKTKLMFILVLMLTSILAFAQHPKNVMVYDLTNTN